MDLEVKILSICLFLVTLVTGGSYLMMDKNQDEIQNMKFGDASTALRVASTTLFSDPNIISLWEFEQNLYDTVGTNDSAGGPNAYGTSTPNGYGIFSYGAHYAGAEADFPVNSYNWSGFTWNVWLRYTTPSDADGKVFDFKGTNRIYVALQPDDTIAGSFVTTPKSVGAYDGVWTMFTFTRSSAGSYTYINGVEFASSTATALVFGETSFTIGDEAGHTVNRHYLGDMDDASLFNRVLTASEISKLYSGSWVEGGVKINNEVLEFN